MNRATLQLATKEDGTQVGILISSNNFVDNDGEIVTKAALEQAVELMDEMGDHGVVDWWHVKLKSNDVETPIVLGQVTSSLVWNGFLIESFEPVCKEVGDMIAANQDDLKVSLEFGHWGKDGDNAYNDIVILRRSLLPADSPANSLTGVNL